MEPDRSLIEIMNLSGFMPSIDEPSYGSETPVPDTTPSGSYPQNIQLDDSSVYWRSFTNIESKKRRNSCENKKVEILDKKLPDADLRSHKVSKRKFKRKPKQIVVEEPPLPPV